MQTQNISQPDSLFWLYADNYRTYNVEVARKFQSINAAIMLSELASRYRYLRDRNELLKDSKHGDDWFFFKMEECEERTCLSRKQQDLAIHILEVWDLIEKKLIGVPSKRYFRLKKDKIQALFFGGKPSLSETDNLENSGENEPEGSNLGCPKGTTCDVQKGQPGHIKEEPKDEHNIKEQDAAKAASPSVSSSDSSKEPKCSAEAFKLEQEIIKLMLAQHIPTWKAPNSHFLAHQCDILLRGGATYQQIINAVLWALEDAWWGKELFKSNTNPGTVIRKNFPAWFKSMKTPKKYGPDRQVRDKNGMPVENDYADQF